ncbi:MAG: hypothetical protein QM520_05075 [Gammaproteobacteria bacterium]|nr:hypothetical protein [Gammaproteobacteria bacterium]
MQESIYFGLAALVLVLIVVWYFLSGKNPKIDIMPLDEPIEPTVAPPVPAGKTPYPIGSSRHFQQNEKLETLVVVHCEKPTKGELALVLLPPMIGSKSLSIEGKIASNEAWKEVLPDQEFQKFRLGMLRYNRQGAVTEVEYSEFLTRCDHFALSISATLEPPDMENEIKLAKKMEEFLERFNQRVSIQILPKSANWSVSILKENCFRVGFLASNQNRVLVYPLLRKDAPIAIYLEWESQVSDEDHSIEKADKVMLNFDIMQLDRASNPFQDFLQIVAILIRMMDAQIANFEGHIMTLEDLQPTGKLIEEYYDLLDKSIFSAGSDCARRVFDSFSIAQP